MAKINFYIQSLLIVVALILGMACLINERYTSIFLLFQLFIGFAQYVGAWVYVAARKRCKLLDIYLFVATAALGLIWIGAESNVSQPVIIILVLIIPWTLALYYWFFSFKRFKNSHG
ncbi:MAG: hypothetical protein AAGF85_12940 [Bacteroidota bacterium]